MGLVKIRKRVRVYFFYVKFMILTEIVRKLLKLTQFLRLRKGGERIKGL